MTYAELLAELRDNILRDSSALVAGTQDRLWSDATLMGYIDQGSNRFARRTLSIRDSTTPAYTQITLVAGQTEYALDPRVLAVYSARFDTDVYDLGRLGHAQLNTIAQPDTLWFDINQAASFAPGRPRCVALDETIETLRVYPIPDTDSAGKKIYLRIARLPMHSVTMANKDESPEFFPEYHMYLLDWAAYRALSNHEIDGEAKDNAETHKAAFEDHIKEAIQENKRRIFTPAAFQFGSGGYSWVR